GGCQAGKYPPLRLATRIAEEAQRVSATATAVARVVGMAATLPAEMDPEASAAVQRAVEDLARRLAVPHRAIQVLRAQAVEWPDTSLGCPQEGMMYAQVITPGFLIFLEAQGNVYEYHTDRVHHAVLCMPTEE
ncbi:MAG: hypothetical protein NZ765_03550, partial [Anaerolineae bacterium]|nr:hypothetical protein [Anaerolineae bacterium]MDW8070630.1 hypothetical protein [Anaerolineae bacterium]